MTRTGRLVRKLGGGLHVRLYRLLGGALVGRIGRAPVLLLTVRGRRSGRLRTIPLLYVPDGERLVVVASNGGAPSHPAWYLNLKASPEAAVQVRRHRHTMVARDANPEERERYWPQLVAVYSPYTSYREKTEREIPIVVLEPGTG
jgi:deazaflavin-dependent oxidoreductase (nitroreductase family)